MKGGRLQYLHIPMKTNPHHHIQPVLTERSLQLMQIQFTSTHTWDG